MLRDRLWQALLAATVIFLIADFVDYEIIAAPDGRAAALAGDVTILQPLGDASSPLRSDADALAAALSSGDHAVDAKSSGLGAAATLVAFGRYSERDGSRLLLLTSAALSEVARAARQPVTGLEAAQARAALRMLARLRPIASVSTDSTAIALPREAGPIGLAELRAGLGQAPGLRVTGIGADAASKASLAGLVNALGIDGRIPYRVFPSGREATLALSTGGVDLVLAPRSELLGEGRRQGLRIVASGREPGLGLGEPPWSVLVGPPSLQRGARKALIRHSARALAKPVWRQHEGARGLRPLRRAPRQLRALILESRRRATELAALTASVPEQR